MAVSMWEIGPFGKVDGALVVSACNTPLNYYKLGL